MRKTAKGTDQEKDLITVVTKTFRLKNKDKSSQRPKTYTRVW